MDENKEPVRGLLLVPYMEEVIGTLKADKKLPAVRTYTATKNSFVKFCDEKELPTETAEVFTAGRLKEYELWLRGRDAEWNTVSTYMRTLKAVYNRLVSGKVLAYDRKLFGDVYTKVESQTKRALSAEQMGTLLHAKFEELPQNVQCALAYFLLMFMFHGMPFIDLAYLRKKDLKGDCIVYCRHKTKRQITVRIPPEARVLLEEYSNKDNRSIYLFPILDGQGEEEKTKNAEKLYERYAKALGSFNRMLAKIASLLLPGVEISSYMSRHTFACLAIANKVSTESIAKMLGHTDIRTTKIYARILDRTVADEMQILRGKFSV